MPVNNFPQISTLLDFENEKSFYFVQILKRRKENPEMKTGVRVINNYYLYSQQDLEKLKERIIEDCVKHNARAYINLNRLDIEKIALYATKLSMEYIIQGDHRAVKNAYATACGSHHSEKNKRWVIDIDEEYLPIKEEIRSIIEELHTEIKGNNYRILAEIPTKSGVHILTNPFNMMKFREIALEKFGSTSLDIHKNSPTILYVA
jgi:hypothetical protein